MPNFGGICSKEEVDEINDNTLKFAAYWTNKI